jgi:hypothetical protein
MRRLRSLAFASVLAAAFAAHADAPLPQVLQVLGNVTNSARPVANALVIALNLKDLDSIQTYSLLDGTFALPPLRAGIYKIIAVKQGFAPAIATVIPTKPSHHVNLALEDEKRARKAKNDEIWEIRASLPPDVLRQIDLVLEPPVAARAASLELPRFKGQMTSVTGVSVGSGGDQSPTTSFAQTSVGVESRIGDSWQLGIKGNLHRIEDPSDAQTFGAPVAQASVMSMELRSSPTDAYRVASTKSTWRYSAAAPADHQADIRSHNFEWEHGAAKLAVRYFAQENLFVSNPFNSDAIEIAGGTTLMQTRRGDLGVSVRVTQESLHNASALTLRTADVTANASFNVVPALVLHYGLSSRLGIEGAELAPRAGAEWKFAKDQAFVLTAMHKAMESPHDPLTMPSIVVWSEDGRLLPRYSYSIGYLHGDENGAHFSAVASVTAVESPLRLVFNDGSEQQFWDGLYIDSGDIRRDLRVSYRKDIGKWIAIDVSTSAGTATPAQYATMNPINAAKSYVTGDIQTILFPTGTSIAVSYLGIEQPQLNRGNYRSERVNLRMAQSLHLPLDLKVLLGLELAHAANSPFLLDSFEPASKKYVGGLAVNF